MSQKTGLEIPAGWAFASLGDALLPTATTDPRKKNDGDFFYVDIEAIDNKRQVVSRARRMQNALAPSRARNSLRPGDVVFSLVRPYLKNIALIPADLDPAVASTAFFVCRPGEGMDSRYLLNFLCQENFIASITTYGSSPPAARDDEFERLAVVIPPSTEQARIADVLDELFSDLNVAVEALGRVRDKLKLYRASVLKAAVEGTLTAEWRAKHPHAEPATELLQRILVERRRRWEKDQLAKFKANGKEPPKNWKGKYREPVVPDTFSLQPLPKGWCWSSLGQCFEVHVGATPSRGVKHYWGGDIPWVASGEVQFRRILDTREKITPEGLANSSTLLNPAGSVVLNMIGEGKTRGKAGILGLAACNNQNCAAIWVSITPVPPQFVYLWLLYQYEQTRELASGNNQPALNKSIVENIAIPLPPLAEQEAIVEIVEDQLSIIDHLEDDLNAKLKSAQALRQSILRDAFTGKLVPQDPNDEPASELLKRIAAEREERVKRNPSGRARGPKVKQARRVGRAEGVPSA